MACPGGLDAVMRQGNPTQEPITAANFLPPQIPNPRAWERVAVPSIIHTRQRKIWKRVGGFPTNALPQSHAAAMNELESNGDVARKRARTARYVPVFGEMTWDERVNDPRDGKRDLTEARAAVSTAQEAHVLLGETTQEDRPSYIPRKRHNSRWPIEPSTSKRQLADLQPLIEFDVPSVAEPIEPTEQADAKKMRRRSTRRFSRRISLSTIAEESPRQLESIILSPAKSAGPVLSPIKRAVITSSPTKVADSPRRLFKVDLPKDTVLNSPKPTLDTMSPCKSSPVSAVTPQQDSIRTSLSAEDTALESSPLLFDQPIPTIQVEPEYETRRRISLLSAKRSDRRSSGFLKAVDFDTKREAPKRRHSFNPAQSAPADIKSRRSSLDVLSNRPDELKATVPSDDKEKHGEETGDQEIPVEPALYEVDVGTNLDIFGQTRHVKKTPVKPASDLPPAAEPTLAVETIAPASSPTVQTEAVVDQIASVPESDQGVRESTDDKDTVLDQAAATPTDVVSDENSEESPELNTAPSRSSSPDVIFDKNSQDSPELTTAPSGSSSEEEDSPPGEQLDTPQSDFEFGPHDPEGLSTIYEEESGMDSTSPQKPSADGVQTADDITRASDMSTLTAEELSEVDIVTAKGLFNDAEETAEVVAQMSQHDDALTLSNTDQGTSNEEEAAEVVAQMSQHDDAPTLTNTEQGTSVEEEAAEVVAQMNQDHDASTLVNDQHGTSKEEEPVADRPATPEKVTEKPIVPSQDGITPDSPHSSESSGFTPINARQVSPTSVSPKPAEIQTVEIQNNQVDSVEVEAEIEDVIMGGVDDEVTTTVDDDFTLNVVEPPKPDNDTLTLARHDDADFVRDFVSRVAAGRSAKAAAAAAVATEPPRKIARPKGRLGSTGSTTTSTGSPVPKSDTPQRAPLSEKDTNSPSPLKKRKLEEDDEECAQPKDEMDNAPEDSGDAPKIKRRRKRADPVLEEPANNTSEPDTTTGPRRSTRARTNRVSLRSAGPSANSIAMSLYPVRLPGGLSGMLDESALDSNLTLSRQRSETKSIETLTRSNTRANKAGAVLPQVVLARQKQDPSWKMKELKSVHDAKESRAESYGDATGADGKKGKKAKGVRWDPELVRYQSDENSSNKVFKTMAKSLLADIINGDGADEEDELAMPTISAVPSAGENSPPAEKLPRAPTPVKPVPARRTRSSRLQAPTPVKKLASGSGVATGDKKSSNTVSPPTVLGPVRVTKASTRRTTTPATTAAKPKSIPVSKASTSTTKASTSDSASRSGMATRRTNVANLGMGVNGTPAPKRRGRTAS